MSVKRFSRYVELTLVERRGVLRAACRASPCSRRRGSSGAPPAGTGPDAWIGRARPSPRIIASRTVASFVLEDAVVRAVGRHLHRVGKRHAGVHQRGEHPAEALDRDEVHSSPIAGKSQQQRSRRALPCLPPNTRTRPRATRCDEQRRSASHQFGHEVREAEQHARRQRQLRAEARVEVLELRQHEDRHDDDGDDREDRTRSIGIRQRALELRARRRLRVRGSRESCSSASSSRPVSSAARHDRDVVAGEDLRVCGAIASPKLEPAAQPALDVGERLLASSSTRSPPRRRASESRIGTPARRNDDSWREKFMSSSGFTAAPDVELALVPRLRSACASRRLSTGRRCRLRWASTWCSCEAPHRRGRASRLLPSW